MVRIDRKEHSHQQPLITVDSYGKWYGIYHVEDGYLPGTLLYYYRRLDYDDQW